MHCHDYMNEWLCDKCYDLFPEYFEKFKKQFLCNKDCEKEELQKAHKHMKERGG